MAFRGLGCGHLRVGGRGAIQPPAVYVHLGVLSIPWLWGSFCAGQTTSHSPAVSAGRSAACFPRKMKRTNHSPPPHHVLFLDIRCSSGTVTMKLKIIDARGSWQRMKGSVFQPRVPGPVPGSRQRFDLGKSPHFSEPSLLRVCTIKGFYPFITHSVRSPAGRCCVAEV